MTEQELLEVGGGLTRNDFTSSRSGADASQAILATDGNIQ